MNKTQQPGAHARHAAEAAALALALTLAAPCAQAQSADLARNLAATCSTCHGNARGDMPPLAGLPAERIVASVASYRSGSQPATVMHQIAKGYTDEQIKLIAGHFAAQASKP